MYLKIRICLIFIFIFITSSVFAHKAYGIDLSIDKFDIMGITCGIPDSDINKCCVGTEAKHSFALDIPEVHVPGSGGAWWNPATYVSRAVQGAINTPSQITETSINFFINLGEKFVEDKVNTVGDNLQKTLAEEKISPFCVDNSTASTEDPRDPNCICKLSVEGASTFDDQCNNVENKKEQQECRSCIGAKKTNNDEISGTWTGIGCVPADLGLFLRKKLLGWAIGMAGGIAILCLIYSAIVLQMSRGNPERIKKAKEYLNACLLGLGLIIFSVLILKIIGVNILHIPGFS